MKYLIVGLGNVGQQYINTRHNVGFRIINELADQYECEFDHTRHAYQTSFQYAGRNFCLIKPTTLVNRSGKAVNYWRQAESIPLDRCLIVVDDIDLPLGKIRLKPKGSAGEHNGLKNINKHLGTNQYPRLRFGIGHNFPQGQQVDYVLGKWTREENDELADAIPKAAEAILSFGRKGLQHTMNAYNE